MTGFRSSSRFPNSVHGLNLVELTVTMAILVVLSSVSSVAYVGLQRRAERIGCTANLRALHAAFSGYTLDRGGWPQEPPGLGKEGARFYGWLVGELSEYGGTRDAWLCPTEGRKHIEGVGEEDFVGSYAPTMFSTGQNRPWEWETQPWLIERTNNHLSGQLVIFPDGRVLSVDEFMNRK